MQEHGKSSVRQADLFISPIASDERRKALRVAGTEEFLIVTSGWLIASLYTPRLHVLPQVSHYRRCVRVSFNRFVVGSSLLEETRKEGRRGLATIHAISPRVFAMLAGRSRLINRDFHLTRGKGFAGLQYLAAPFMVRNSRRCDSPYSRRFHRLNSDATHSAEGLVVPQTNNGKPDSFTGE